ncbi:MAG: tol-pal system protein YbgF [Deltaproteobacteria bacterium]|jgi:tol-pal system protein YbgF|nr:tol-pal system protein YbgF [Deltaproteobacteria bacterium]
MSFDNVGLKLVGFSLGLALLASGCAGGTLGGSSNLQREVDVLKMEVADLRDRSRLSDMGGGGQAVASDLRLDVDNLRLSIQRLTENIETASLGGLTLRQQLEYLSARIDRLEKTTKLPPLSPEVVAGSSPIGPPIVAPPVSSPALPPNTPTVPPTPDQTATVQPTQGSDAPPPVAKTAYDEGKALFDQKKYPEAIDKLKDYLASEPSGRQAGAAQFYVGECLYNQNKYEDAILEYQNLVTGYPKNTLVSAALLKQGLSFQALGDKSSAKLFYQKVVREYPKSYSAGVAKERLKTI